MRVYVNLIHTIAIDVDHADYDAADDAELLADCQDDGDFAERLTTGPHALYDADWEIADLNRQQTDALNRERPHFVLTVNTRRAVTGEAT